MTDLFDRLQAALGETYAISEELGGGGMSRVFRAEEKDLGRDVVIKVLPPDMAAGVNKERFQREIKLAAKLQHPHVVPLLTAGQVDGDLLYYVMPFIEGESLRTKLAREGELPIDEALRILREVSDALSYAHQHEVVHRDIKPDNVMITGNHAVVTDFGVAKAVSASSGGTASSLTSLGVALGTPAYMSPEQAAADPHVDHRADIYAVGALAYEMLCGRPPFVKQTPQQVLAAQVNETPEPVTSHRGSVPPSLDALITRCLAKRPADRWQTADEIRVQFESMATPQSGGLTPTGTQPAAEVGAHTPVRVAAMFGGAAALTLVVVYGTMVALGLPSWVFVGAIALLAIGLPIMLVTGKHERARAVAMTTGMQMATPTGMQRHFTWKKAITGGGLAFAGLAVVAGGYMGMRLGGIGPFATLMATGALDAEARIVLADFDNATDDSTLGATVAELFRIDLNESPTINLLSTNQVDAVLTRMERPGAALTPEVATEIAVREGVKAYLTGDIRSLGEGYLLSARLVSAETGEDLISEGEQAGGSAEIIGAVDRLALRIRERIGESFSSLRADPALANVTTSSLVALELYQQATRVDREGDQDRAIALLEQAVAIDSNFAMAWRRMGSFMGNPGAGRQEEGRQALRRAYDLRNRLSERERLHVEAMHASRVLEDHELAITALLALIEKWPTDGSALNNIAVMYRLVGNLAASEEWYRRYTEMGDAAGRRAFLGLSGTQWLQGKYDAADSTMVDFIRYFPGHPDALDRQAAVASARGRYDEASAVLDEYMERHGAEPEREAFAYSYMRAVAAVQGQLNEASRLERERLIVNSERRGNFPRAERPIREAMYGAQVAAWFDLSRPSREEVDALWNRVRETVDRTSDDELPWEDFILIHALSGDAERARSMFADYQMALGEDGREQERQNLMFNEGLVFWAEGQADSAVTRLRTVLDEQPFSPNFRRGLSWYLADSFVTLNEADSARVYFEEVLSIPSLRGVFSDADFLAVTLVRLGELYETQDPEKAAEYYSRFVDLWENADPELQPRVADVRSRIARLVAERPSAN